MKKDIYELAVQFRNAIDKAKEVGEFDKDFSFNRFPRACCGDASDLLGHFLLENGIETYYVCGNYYREGEGFGQSHAWLLDHRNTIIDITGDQFKYETEFLNYDIPVYVGAADDFHALFEVEKRDIRQISYIENLGPICVPRLLNLYSVILKYIE